MGWLNFWQRIKAGWARRILAQAMVELNKPYGYFLCEVLNWSMYHGFSPSERCTYLSSFDRVRRQLKASIMEQLNGELTVDSYVCRHVDKGIDSLNFRMMKQIRLMWCLNSMAHIRITSRIEMSSLSDTVTEMLEGVKRK